ncbi:DUF305 domain-containing protein [Mycobacterium sp. IS-1496]|uniref:DUF305 domain-containing protein n=1 Tax=Mycobacterium sp. IS-1496 TaxID=1772284 RepID=UPI0007417874|nr:DUF305 domain-containing protein [Mycobacterium sp. IS-1496]KUI33540.1 DUF305 domain-containing protein [Mycobacterium sp. IS-1496]
MNRNRSRVFGAAAAALVTVLASCGDSGNEQAAAPSPAPVQTSSVAPAAAHNQTDVMFAHHMIPHHRQAIEMSDMVTAKPGVDPRVVEMAKQIKAAQGPEIEQMQGWVDQWGMPGPNAPRTDMGPHHGGMPGGSMMPGMPGMPAMNGMPGMDGMMSPAEMQALQNARGVEASRLFLTQMIRHHEGAITMAQNEIDNGQFPDTIALAESIVSSQRKEIDTMNQILGSL